jgi:formylglycine-generating enzyme required for sulfatase activity
MTRYLLLELLLTALATLTAYVIVWPRLKERWPGVAKFFVVLVAVGIFLFFHLYYFFTRERFEDVMADFIGDTVCQLHAFRGCPDAKTGTAIAAPAPVLQSEPQQVSRGTRMLKPAPMPGTAFKDCETCPEMVVLPAGDFTMGTTPNQGPGLTSYENEQPSRRVTINTPFAVGKFEVTFAEWEACVAGGGCKNNPTPDDSNWGRGDRPVINVSWYDAKDYVAWLSRSTGQTYRLLSEAEWEYAARAGTTTETSFGNHYTDKQMQFRIPRTAEVGTFPANQFGLHDMHANVWEWVEDNYHPNYQGAPLDGSVWQGGESTLRVTRGGSWNWHNNYRHFRSAFRDSFDPAQRTNDVGFRVARNL